MKSATRFVVCLLLLFQSAANLDEDMMELSLLSMDLCLAVESQVLGDFADSSTLYIDGSNAALVYESNDYCFFVSDTTTRYDIQDWNKNLDLTVSSISYGTDSGESCRVRNGYRRAYQEPSYRGALEQEIRDCHSRGKQVVLTGHSMGGAVASVAAIPLHDVNPMIITFGQPPAIVGDCPVIDADKYFRFENTKLNQGLSLHIDYDPVPQFRAQANQIGSIFILGEDTNNVVGYGDGTSPSIIKYGLDVDAHFSAAYRARLVSYQGKSIGTDGWNTGFRCNLNEECKSGKCNGGWWFGTSGRCT